jgi:hypothetical protein
MAWALQALCVAIHAAGMVALAMVLLGKDGNPQRRFGPDLWLLIRLAWGIIVIHVVEILVWAAFYVWMGCMPDLERAYYFSSVTYTTVGYGDLVLSPQWRSMAAAEALTGILMTGLSTGFFFMVLNRLFGSRFNLR